MDKKDRQDMLGKMGAQRLSRLLFEKEKNDDFSGGLPLVLLFIVFLGFLVFKWLPDLGKHQDQVAWETLHLKGAVRDVRFSSAQVSSGDPSGGALLGALVAGPLGAAAGASSEAPEIHNDVVACSFLVDVVEDSILKTLKYVGTGTGTSVRLCSLLREGDTVALEQYKTTVTWVDKKQYVQVVLE